MRLLNCLHNLLQDIRYAGRSFAKDRRRAQNDSQGSRMTAELLLGP